ncbi:MAG: hypothetical protein ACUVXI_17860 [bacterium]
MSGIWIYPHLGLAAVLAILSILVGVLAYQRISQKLRERAEALARQREIEEAAREAAELERLRQQMTAEDRRRLELGQAVTRAVRSDPRLAAEALRGWMLEE